MMMSLALSWLMLNDCCLIVVFDGLDRESPNLMLSLALLWLMVLTNLLDDAVMSYCHG